MDNGPRVRRRWLWLGGIAALAVLVLVVLPAGYVSVAEQRNVFCTS